MTQQLFLTADNAPNKPIPLWSTHARKLASLPVSPSNDGRFEIIAPAGTYRLQVVYRDADVGWLAIDPGVRIQAKDARGAVYVGALRLELDPHAAADAKRSRPSKPPIQILDDYAADYAWLTSSQISAADLPTTTRIMTPAKGVKATAILSMNAVAESEAKAESVVEGVSSGRRARRRVCSLCGSLGPELGPDQVQQLRPPLRCRALRALAGPVRFAEIALKLAKA
jgi:hypothetical protein